MKTAVAAFATLVALAQADLMLHNPRGSNNKLSDQNENVPNKRRLFNSNNWYSEKNNFNNEYYGSEGGYNAPSPGGSMYYFAGSILPIEFTIDNGCGSNTVGGGVSGSHCDIVLQYMCADTVRDGVEQDRIPGTLEASEEKEGNYFMYGMHENWDYYEHCRQRPRNKGLFTGDRQFNADNQKSARFTRQNPAGQQFGYECAEERDYYPYWHPTPWRDIAVITDHPDRCAYYQANSQNTAGKSYCKTYGVAVEDECPQGNWTTVPAWQDAAPDCIEAPWIAEHLMSNKMDGYPIYYNWTVPNLASMACAVRVRYNVTNGDWATWPQVEAGETSLSPVPYDTSSGKSGWLNWEYNGEGVTPFQAQETVKVCDDNVNPVLCNVTLYQMNELMPSRVFQDRSHRFSILPRPETVKNRIHNLNVRGKRGNIVQTFPAVEYDFVPNVLHCKRREWIHVQWTGSDNNRQNVAGEGTDQTDRSNIAQMKDFKRNKPLSSPQSQQVLFREDSAIALAFNSLNLKESLCDPYGVVQQRSNNDNEREEDPRNCAKLNPQTPYFDAGLQPCLQPGTYYYLSTRNNNFSNRSQKGVIVVHPCNGEPECVNEDELPVNNDGFFDPNGRGFASAAHSLRATLTLVVASLIAAATFAFAL